MTKKLSALIIAVCLLCLSLAGCSGTSGDLTEASLQTEDFTYTLSATQLEYNKEDLNADAPFDVTLQIEYTGDQDTVQLWCVEDLGTITMENSNGKPLLQNEFLSRDTTRVTLEKGTPYTITWNGAEEYKEYNGIPEGNYKVVAYLNFSTDQEYDGIQENTLDLDIKVK